MKFKKVSLVSAVLSFITSFIAAYIVLYATEDLTDGVGVVIATALVFFLLFIFGYIGLRLSMILTQKKVFKGNRLWLSLVAAAAVVVLLISALGQFLFGFSIGVNVDQGSANMVLLLDTSGSMAGFESDRNEASIEFIDELNENCNLKICSFTSMIMEDSGFKRMNSSGKDEMKEFVLNIDSIGGTDYQYVLTQTLDDLKATNSKTNGAGVIMVTDSFDAGMCGNGEFLNEDIIDEYLDAGVKFFLIRLGTEGADDESLLVDLAKRSGGFDTVLDYESFSAQELFKAFENAFESTKELEPYFSGDNLVTKRGISVYQFLIRTLTMFLCSAVIGVGYYATLDRKSFLINGIPGAVASVVITAFGKTLFGCALIMGILIATAFVSFENNGGETIDV